MSRYGSGNISHNRYTKLFSGCNWYIFFIEDSRKKSLRIWQNFGHLESKIVT